MQTVYITKKLVGFVLLNDAYSEKFSILFHPFGN